MATVTDRGPPRERQPGGRHRWVRGPAVLALAASFAVVSAQDGFAAPAAGSADDEMHRVGIDAFMLGDTRAGARKAIRTGEVKSLRFAFGVDLLSEHGNGSDTTETIRLTLPAGLRFGDAPADAKTLFHGGVPSRWTFSPQSESCTVSARSAVCTATGVPSGTMLFGWLLDVVASSAGTYEILAELTPADGFTRPSGRLNGRAVLTVLVGAPKLVVGTPRISRSKLQPSILRVVVPMTSNGAPVSPTAGRFTFDRCVARMLQDPGYRKKRALGHPGGAAIGSVRCSIYFNNAQYRGMTLAGEIHVRVAGKSVVRKFTVRLGSGSDLGAPVGAVIEKATSNTKQPPSK